MISVIIPLMPIKPYADLVVECRDSLMKQTVRHEVITVTQEVEKFINKNKLLNEGVKLAKGDVILFSDADFIFDDDTLLKRMEEKIAEGYEVVYPKFFSLKHQCLQIADGAPCFKRDVIERHGPLDESLLGVSLVTFPFLNWALKNTKLYCGNDITINHKSGWRDMRRRDSGTKAKLRKVYDETVKLLKGRGAWPA